MEWDTHLIVWTECEIPRELTFVENNEGDTTNTMLSKDFTLKHKKILLRVLQVNLLKENN